MIKTFFKFVSKIPFNNLFSAFFKKIKNNKAITILILKLLSIISLYVAMNRDDYEISFKQTLNYIRQNSIKNFEWKESDWQNYYDNQIKRLPIFTKKYFLNCIENALKDLNEEDNSLIDELNNLNGLTKKISNHSITIKDGIGIIIFPSLISNKDDVDSFLNENWIIDFHLQIEKLSPKVTIGWVIDLTNNSEGNIYTMLAALSYFYNESSLGGFCSLFNNMEEKIILSFDGQVFKLNDKAFLSYKNNFRTNQNQLPVNVIIGPNTADSGEFLALALKRQKNIILIGDCTKGKSTKTEIIQLPNDLGKINLTVAYFLDVDDKPLLEKKVIPQIEIIESWFMKIKT